MGKRKRISRLYRHIEGFFLFLILDKTEEDDDRIFLMRFFLFSFFQYQEPSGLGHLFLGKAPWLWTPKVSKLARLLPKTMFSRQEVDK